jgi:polyhydroxybutyrate depolymerase
MGDLAAQRGFLYVHPDGTRDDNEDRFWNATGACCDFDHKGVNDVAYLSSLIDEIEAKYAVDPKRIYLVGHSNGGFMSHAMACARADRIAAIVSLAGATFVDPDDCAATAPVAVVEVHGTADDTILYDGGQSVLRSGAMDPYPGAITSVASWAEIDGCDPSPTTVDDRLDLDEETGGATDPSDTTVQRWIGCKQGGAAELWSITNGSHAPELTDGFGAAVLDFFDAHPKP